jgi:hypothetical protein
MNRQPKSARSYGNGMTEDRIERALEDDCLRIAFRKLPR